MPKVIVWTDPGGCSTCKYCSMDMDMEPFCVHSKVLKKYRWGLNINAAVQDFCTPDLILREEVSK